LPFGVIATSFAAFEKAYLNSLFNMLSALLLFTILIITVSLHLNLVTYGILYGCVNVVVNVIRVIVFRFITKKGRCSTNIQLAESPDSMYSTILGTGIRLTLYGLAVVASANLSNLIISNTLGVAKVVSYSLVYKLLNIAFTFLYGLNSSMSPLLGKEFGLQNWKWIIKTYNRLFLITSFLASLIVVGSVLFIDDIILVWVGPGNFVGIATVIVLSLWFFIGGLSNINYMVINAFNYTKGIYFITWADIVIFLVSSSFLVHSIGILGVALALLSGSTLVSIWILPLMVYKRSGGRLKYDFRYLILTTLVAIGCIAFVGILRRLIQIFVVLLGAKIIVLLLYVVASFMLFPVEFKLEVKDLFQKRSYCKNDQ
jgi:O-antigen/teichoic acid export membrane protein